MEDGCRSCLRYTLIAFNAIFMILGLTWLGLSVYAYTQSAPKPDYNSILVLTDNQDTLSLVYKYALICALSGGCLMVVIALLGILGYCKENWKGLLSGQFCLLLLLLVGGAVASSAVYFQNLSVLEDAFLKLLQGYQSHSLGQANIDPTTRTWDEIQIHFSCCGVRGAADWTNSSLFNRPPFPDMQNYYVPESCCFGFPDSDIVNECLRHPHDPFYSDRMNGCFYKLIDSLKNKKQLISIIAIVAIAFLLLKLILAFNYALFQAPSQAIKYEPVRVRL